MQDYNQSYAFIAHLAGPPETTLVDFRAIHSVRKDVPAIPFRGFLPDVWSTILKYQSDGYGIFINVNMMGDMRDEYGKITYQKTNVLGIRAHFVDLDTVDAVQNYERASQWEIPPHFAVSTSEGKFHVYWLVEPYSGNEYFTLIQRKLRQLFDGDNKVVDASRVLRLPGTLHSKDGSPWRLVSFWQLGAQTPLYNVSTLEQALGSVNVVEGLGVRKSLGEADLSAPSLEWLAYGLQVTDPNDLDRGEWIALMAAFKQAGWSLTTPEHLYDMWSQWCSRYEDNDVAENLKHWESIRETELGWKSIVSRTPTLKAQLLFGEQKQKAAITQDAPQMPMGDNPMQGVVCQSSTVKTPALPDLSEAPILDCKGEMLNDAEQKQWFKGCVYVTDIGKILTEDVRFLTSSQFNVKFGGKKFIIDSIGKTVNEPWQAATRSTLWQVPKVDHIRFLPSEEYGYEIMDDLSRKGVNIYKPSLVRKMEGSPHLFERHLDLIMPHKSDQKTFLDNLAHNVKYPGFKIPWAWLLQSEQGAGKGVFKRIIRHSIGRSYTYFPNAKDLADSGAKFNAWMRAKLFILADEIKVDDRRDMIEVLKPMISEAEIEVQAKGQDQKLEDNWANWGFFSNFKDAIPTTKNDRRFAIYYLTIQTLDDLIQRGMDDAYFKTLYDWLDKDGCAIVANYLSNYQIERGDIPMRAPVTTSTKEAIRLSRTAMEQMISDAVEDGIEGFRGGWISNLAVHKRNKDLSNKRISNRAVSNICEALGYKSMGRAPRSYFQEGAETKAELYNLDATADVNHYGRAQGYE